MATKNSIYPLNLIFRLINSESDEYIDPDNYEVSLPMYSAGRVNTKVILKPLISTNIYGSLSFYYNRLLLSELGTIKVNRTTETYLADLLEQMNDNSMFYISTRNISGGGNTEEIGKIFSSEIVNKKIPPFGSNNETYMNLISINNSYILTGHTPVRISKG